MRWWEKLIGLDVRSLAILRIGLGLLTAADAVQRIIEAPVFLTDRGVTPRTFVAAGINHWFWSVHLASDALWWQLLLLVAVVLAGLALAVGYRTGWATAIAWALTLSVQNRNEVILDGGDMVQRLLLFWSMFVPLGAVWSVDALSRLLPSSALRPVATAGSAALKLQMAMIFFFAAILKSGPPWRENFNAVWYTLQWDFFITPLGVWLRQFPEFLRWLTGTTLAIEFLGPILLFVPYAPVQVAAIAAMVGLHIGFAACMHLLMFSGVMTAGWLALTPGWLWDRLGVPFDLEGNAARWRARLAAHLPHAPARLSWFEKWPQFSRVFVTVCLLYVVAWNIRSTHHDQLVKFFPAKLNAFGFVLRLDQFWTMFAPSPVNEDGWFVIPGKLVGGAEVDLFRDGAPVSWDRPDSIAATYRDRRWRRFYWMVTGKDHTEIRRHYAQYLCREWDQRHDEVLTNFQIVFMYEVANPDLTVSAPQKMVLWEQKCQ